MAQDDKKPPIGAGHASAMLRQGLAELRQAVYPDSNVAAQPQYGLYGTRTPGEVMQDRKAEGRDPDEEPSALNEPQKDGKHKSADKDRDVREPEPPEPERE